MIENVTTNINTIQKSKKNLVLKLLAFIGICCLLQFFIVGPLGMIQSDNAEKMSDVIFVAGLLFVLPYIPRQKRSIVCIYFISFMGIYPLFLSFGHGYHAEKGSIYYNKGQYQEALVSFKKETQAWYLRMRYNHHERKAMEMMAETYCQLGDFNNARDTYKLIIGRYSDEFYVRGAQKRLEELEKGLKVVANYPELDPEAKGFLEDLYNIARTYEYDLNCHTKAFEVYTKILDMDIAEELKAPAKGAILQLRVN